MRNILTVLTLCVLTLITSSVFANEYDETKRMERLGLSYYDGRPLYVVMFGFTGPDYAPVGYSMSYYRVFTGDNLSDFGTSSFQGEGRKAVVTYGDITVQERYFYSVIDADGMTVFSSNDAYSDPYRAWTLELIERYPPPQYASEDIGVYTFDAISERSRTWLLPALGVALALFGVRYCYRLLVRMICGESGVGLGGATESIVSASRGDDSVSGDYARASSVATSDSAWENVDVSNADEYATGEALGQEFTPKAVASNVDLQNEWSRLSESERAELLGDDFGGAPFGDRAYPRRQGNYYVDLERDNYYVDLTDEDER